MERYAEEPLPGWPGHPGARIFCSKLQAELLAIDGVYQTADDMPAKAAGQAGAGLAGRRTDENLSAGLRGTQMGKVLVVTSGKGGVGKTTSTAALGAALARGGENVVVIDFDVGCETWTW